MRPCRAGRCRGGEGGHCQPDASPAASKTPYVAIRPNPRNSGPFGRRSFLPTRPSARFSGSRFYRLPCRTGQPLDITRLSPPYVKRLHTRRLLDSSPIIGLQSNHAPTAGKASSFQGLEHTRPPPPLDYSPKLPYTYGATTVPPSPPAPSPARCPADPLAPTEGARTAGRCELPRGAHGALNRRTL